MLATSKVPFPGWPDGDGSAPLAPSLWDDSLLLGQPDLDNDHRALFAMIVRLDTLGTSSDPGAAVSDVLCQLADYSREHFAREENLMRLCRFPRCSEHVVEHYKFIRQLTVLVDIFERGRPDVVPECRAFLGRWFLDHISVADMEFANYLRDYTHFTPS